MIQLEHLWEKSRWNWGLRREIVHKNDRKYMYEMYKILVKKIRRFKINFFFHENFAEYLFEIKYLQMSRSC